MALRKITSLFGIIAFAAMLVFVFTGCEEPKSPPLKVIDIASIQGVTVPATGETPVTTITENAQYRGTVTWSYNPVAFIANVQYTATINLTPKSGYTLKGVEANFFTVVGATSVSNDANSGIITAVFPSGCSITIDMYDSDGDGWGRSALKIEVNGTELSPNATIIDGYSNSYVFNVTNGDLLKIYWISGEYDSECSFMMYYTDKPPIPEFTAGNNSNWSGVNALFYKSFNTLNNISSGTLLGTFTVEGNTIINVANIKGVTIPVIGGVPVTTITETTQYSGTVTWNGTPSIFAGSTVYTATITLTPKPGYTLHGVAANFFTITGAASVSNAANSGIITAVFPETAKINLSISITAPVKGATPTANANSNTESGSNFTIGQVSWSPSHNPFLGGTVYTASVTLTANSGYTFNGLSSSTINGQNAVVSNNTGSTVTLSYTFPATNTKTVTEIAIKTQPTKLNYIHGDTLNLAGLVITLTHDDSSTEDIAAADFTAKNVTATPAQGNNLVHSMHNGQPVRITYGNLTKNTNNVVVNKATPTTADFNINGIGTFYYDGNSRAVTVTPKDGKTTGSITIKYNGNTIEPSAAGIYTVTFDVTETTNSNAANGLSAGILTIEKITPTAADFDINGIGTFYYDGGTKLVNITPKAGKSNGTITVKYNGITTEPSTVGKYIVTFDVAETTSFNAVKGLSAGLLTINPFTSIASLQEYLQGRPANSVTTPYIVALNVNDISGIKDALEATNVSNKYVTIDLSDSTITSIPDNTFSYYKNNNNQQQGCTTLVGITIPNSVTSIGQYAFSFCTSLTSVTIPNSVTSIGQYAFFRCTSLANVTIPDGVTNIEECTFSICTSLSSVTIPDSVTSIGKYAFHACTGLTSVTIGNSVTSIGKYAFNYCASLTSVTIPDIKEIADFT